MNLFNANLLPADHFLIDWAIIHAIGGFVFLMLGLFVGWMIWRNYRHIVEQVEEQNREAMSFYDKTSDRLSRLKAELANHPES